MASSCWQPPRSNRALCSLLEPLGTCPVTCHGSLKATRQLRVQQQGMGVEEEPTAPCAALKYRDLRQPLTQGIFSQDKSALTQHRMGSTKPALPWCSTHGGTPRAWEWAGNRPGFLWNAARGQRCPETAAEPSPTLSCLSRSLQPQQEPSASGGAFSLRSQL